MRGYPESFPGVDLPVRGGLSRFKDRGPTARIEGVPGKNSAWKSHYALDDRAFTPITGEVPSGKSRIVLSIPYSLEDSSSENPDFWASLLDEKTGGSLPLEFRVSERFPRTGGGTLLGELMLLGIPAGAYRLYVYQKSSGPEPPAYAQIPLRIRLKPRAESMQARLFMSI